MKRIGKITAFMLVVVLALALFAGCGKSSPAGIYYIESIDGQPFEDYFVDVYIAATGMTLEEYFQKTGFKSVGEHMTWEFREDGTAVGKVIKFEQNVGKWRQDGDKIIFYTDDAHPEYGMEFTLKGKKLIWSEFPGTEWIYVKK